MALKQERHAGFRETTPRFSSRWLRLGLLAPYLLLLGTAYSVFAQTVDDPYITFRYAANFGAGHGPVFNIGERVEGYTSPLHLLLSLVLMALAPSVDILFKAKCASLLFGFVMLVQTGTLARRSGLGAGEAALAQALVALNINFALAAVNALETTLYGSLLLASLLVFLKECRRGQGVFSGFALFCALLARPEAALTIAALFVVRLYWMRHRRLSLFFVLAWLPAFLVPAGLCEIARWDYYGQLLPNTYFAKAQPLGQSISLGSAYLLRATAPGTPASDLLDSLFSSLSQLNRHTLFRFDSLQQKNIRSDVFYLVMPLLFWGLALAGLWRLRQRLAGFAALAVVAAVFVFVLRSGGDWMYGWRFVAPILPVIAVAQCHGIRAFARRLTRPLSPGRGRAFAKNALRWCGGAVAALWLASCFKTEHFPWSKAHFSTQGAQLLQVSEGYGPLWVKGADYIRRLPRGSTLAYSEMGYAGYANLDKKMIDVRGLTDREISHLPAKYKYMTGVSDKAWYQPGDPLYRILQQRKPGVILSFNPVPPNTVLSGYRRGEVLAMPTNDTQGLSFVYVYERL